MVDEFDAPSRSGRVWPCPLRSHKPCDPRCLSRWDLHRRGEASMSCKHYSASRLHAVGKSRRSRLSFRWYHLTGKTTRVGGEFRPCSKLVSAVGFNGIWGPHHWEIYWLSGTSRSADGLCSAPSGALRRFCSSCAAPQWSQLLRSPGATSTCSLKLRCEKQVPWHVNLESPKKAARQSTLLTHAPAWNIDTC